MSKDLGASDEDLIRRSDDESDKKLSFFDNTIDESENDSTVVESVGPIEEMIPGDTQSDQEKNVFAKDNKSFMEIEVKRDKMRWRYISELGAVLGEEKHTREGFIKVFQSRVSHGIGLSQVISRGFKSRWFRSEK